MRMLLQSRPWPAALLVVLFTTCAQADVRVKTCAPEPGVTDMAYGDLVNCEITPVGDSDLFRFSGQAGDKVDILVLRYNGSADACFRVIQPDGTLGQYFCVGFFREATVGSNVTLKQSGTHTIQVVDG